MCTVFAKSSEPTARADEASSLECSDAAIPLALTGCACELSESEGELRACVALAVFLAKIADIEYEMTIYRALNHFAISSTIRF